MTEDAVHVVHRFVDRLSAKDWDAFATTLHEDVERVGPYADVVSGRSRYVEFLAGVLEGQPDYALVMRRVTWSADQRVAFAEVTERVVVDGRLMEYPEVLAFELDTAGLITRVGVYTMRPGSAASRHADRFFEQRGEARARE